MTDNYEVVVADGGPVGMWLAAELRRAGVAVVVLEKRAERPSQSKALTVYPRTATGPAATCRWLPEVFGPPYQAHPPPRR
jgi:2-polyprenyl-6-methoxyphenol hydroxylase-like FAD-dependent oxidoreductase